MKHITSIHQDFPGAHMPTDDSEQKLSGCCLLIFFIYKENFLLWNYLFISSVHIFPNYIFYAYLKYGLYSENAFFQF